MKKPLLALLLSGLLASVQVHAEQQAAGITEPVCDVVLSPAVPGLRKAILSKRTM
jgi:hypothetical protein